MSTDISIEIRALDRFGPVFEQLQRALQEAGGGGETAARALALTGGALDSMAQQATAAQAVLGSLEQAALDAWSGLEASQDEHLQALGTARLEAAQTLAAQSAQIEESALAERQGNRLRAWAIEEAALHAHHNALLSAELGVQTQMQAIEQAGWQSRLEGLRQFTASIQALAAAHGAALAQAAKALAIAEALISTYLAAGKALASVPYPFNIAAAVAVTAQGLANVERIRQVSIAHGGLDYVPDDATFLLQRGERVLAPNQNQELTRFLSAAGQDAPSGPMVVENLTVHVLENATSAEALLTMDSTALRRVVAERIIPALDVLAQQGIKPQFVDSNT